MAREDSHWSRFYDSEDAGGGSMGEQSQGGDGDQVD